MLVVERNHCTALIAVETIEWLSVIITLITRCKLK